MENVKKEILGLHADVEEWINGKYERSDAVFSEIYSGRLTDNFQLVAPTGHRLGRDTVVKYIEGIYGTSPDFRISITDVQVICESNDIVVAHCLMWHSYAPESDNANLGRNLTAVFLKDSSMSNGLKWKFVHESALPQEEIDAKFQVDRDEI